MIAHAVGVLTVIAFVLGIVWNAPHLGGTAAGVGVIIYAALRLLRGILDPLILWLLTRNADA